MLLLSLVLLTWLHGCIFFLMQSFNAFTLLVIGIKQYLYSLNLTNHTRTHSERKRRAYAEGRTKNGKRDTHLWFHGQYSTKIALIFHRNRAIPNGHHISLTFDINHHIYIVPNSYQFSNNFHCSYDGDDVK